MGVFDIIFGTIGEILNKSPISIVLIVLFSYSIWSKFFNKGKFQPKSIDDIFDIVIVFLILLFSLTGLTFLLIYLIPILKLESIDLKTKLNSVLTLIVLELLIIFILFGKRKATKRDLQAIFEYLLVLILLGIVGLITFIFAFYKPIYKEILFNNLIWLLTILFIAFFSSIFFGYQRLFTNKLLIHKKSLFGFVILALIITLTISLLPRLLLPKLIYGEQKIISYELKDWLYRREYKSITPSYEFLSQEHIINNYGYLDWLPLYYGNIFTKDDLLSIDLKYSYYVDNKLYNTTYSIFDVKKNQFSSSNEYGITNMYLDNNSDSIIVWFNKDVLDKKMIVGFIINGKKDKNLTKEELLIKDLEKECDDNNNCNIILNITNKLNVSILLKNDELFGYRDILNGNIEECNVNKIDTEEYLFGRVDSFSRECNANAERCDSDGYKLNFNVIPMKRKWLYIPHMNIRENSSSIVTLNLSC